MSMLSDRALRVLNLLILLMAMGTFAMLVGACSQAGTPPPAATSPAPAKPTATVARVTARLIPHPVAGQEDCHRCHGEGQAVAAPEDHAGRGDDTCLVCHDVQPPPRQPFGGSAADQGKAIWQERPGLPCRDCHGIQAEGGYGPPLADTSIDSHTFLRQTRSPQPGGMPPAATAPDDPAFEASGTWISDDDLRLVYSWLAGVEP